VLASIFVGFGIDLGGPRWLLAFLNLFGIDLYDFWGFGILFIAAFALSGTLKKGVEAVILRFLWPCFSIQLKRRGSRRESAASSYVSLLIAKPTSTCSEASIF